MDTTVAVSDKKSSIFSPKKSHRSPPSGLSVSLALSYISSQRIFLCHSFFIVVIFFSGASQKANQNLRQQGDLIL